MRTNVLAMRSAGELALALRTLDRADVLCPPSAHEGRALQLDTATELEVYSRSRALAAVIEADPRATPTEKQAAARARANNAAADYGSAEPAGHLASLIQPALARSDVVERSRLLARTLVALERAERAPLVADAVGWAPDGSPGAWSSDGAWLALHGSDFRTHAELITIFDARTWQPRLRIRPGADRDGDFYDLMRTLRGQFDVGPRSAVLVEDGGRIVSIDLYSGQTKSVIADWRPTPTLPSCNSSEEPAALSAQADLIAIPWPSGGVRLYRASTGALLKTLAAPNVIGRTEGLDEPSIPCRTAGARLLRFARDGSMLAFASPEGGLRVWGLSDAQPRMIGTLHATPTALVFSPDGNTLAATTYPPTKVDLFETRTGRRLAPLPLPEDFVSGMLGDHDNVLRSLTDKGLTVVDLQGTPVVRTLPSHGTDTRLGVFTTADGALRVVDSEAVRTYDRDSSKERIALQFGSHPLGRATAVAVDRKAIATLVIRDYSKGSEIVLARVGQPNVVRIPVSPLFLECCGQVAPGALGFDPSGRYFAVLEAADVALIDVASGRRTPLSVTGAKAFSFDPSGRVVAVAGVQGNVQLWDAERAVVTRSIDAGVGSITALAWSLDGRRLAYGSALGAVRVVDVATGRSAALDLSLEVQRAVRGLVFDDSGQKLYARGADLSARTWDLTRGKLLAPQPPTPTPRPFGDPRFDVEVRYSSTFREHLPAGVPATEETDAQVRIRRCTAPAHYSREDPALSSAFPEHSPDCRVSGYASGENAMLGSVIRPDERVEVTSLDSGDALYLRGSSPDMVADKAQDSARVRLLSGDVISVSASTFDVFSSVDALGSDSHLECRVSRWVFPIEACRSLLLRKDLLSDAVSGDPSYRDE